MHRFLFRFVLCVDFFGGTDGVAEKKNATTQLRDERRGMEEKDRNDFISFNSIVFFPSACVCRT